MNVNNGAKMYKKKDFTQITSDTFCYMMLESNAVYRRLLNILFIIQMDLKRAKIKNELTFVCVCACAGRQMVVDCRRQRNDRRDANASPSNKLNSGSNWFFMAVSLASAITVQCSQLICVQMMCAKSQRMQLNSG